MGLLGKLFGGGKEYPALDASSGAAARMNKYTGQLKALMEQVGDEMEVIPGESTAFVYIGKPPKYFGLAWLEEGKTGNLKDLGKERGISEMGMQVISEKLREAYKRSEAAPRFALELDGRKIVVTDSDALVHEVAQILHAE